MDLGTEGLRLVEANETKRAKILGVRDQERIVEANETKRAKILGVRDQERIDGANLYRPDK